MSKMECLEHHTEIKQTVLALKKGSVVIRPPTFVLKCKKCLKVFARECGGVGIAYPYKGEIKVGPKPEELV